jgi:hypothetical protein
MTRVRCLVYEVWRTSWVSGQILERTFRWRWLARLYAWEHTKRGWFHYEVKESR